MKQLQKERGKYVNSSQEIKKDAVQATSLQPPSFDVITMAPGVTMVEGSRTKAGSERNADPKHLSLKT